MKISQDLTFWNQVVSLQTLGWLPMPIFNPMRETLKPIFNQNEYFRRSKWNVLQQKISWDQTFFNQVASLYIMGWLSMPIFSHKRVIQTHIQPKMNTSKGSNEASCNNESTKILPFGDNLSLFHLWDDFQCQSSTTWENFQSKAHLQTKVITSKSLNETSCNKNQPWSNLLEPSSSSSNYGMTLNAKLQPHESTSKAHLKLKMSIFKGPNKAYCNKEST